MPREGATSHVPEHCSRTVLLDYRRAMMLRHVEDQEEHEEFFLIFFKVRQILKEQSEVLEGTWN